MKHFKKILIIAFLGLLLCSFFSCSGRAKKHSQLKNWMQESKELRILCTTAQIGDIVQLIGGERVKTWVLIQGDLDPHSYELVKGDDEKIFFADSIFYNGLNLEHGASLSALLHSSPKSVGLGDLIAMQYPEKILKRGDIVDPHIWMDVSIWTLTIDPILEKIIALDPEGASYYKERANNLKDQMLKTHSSIKEKLREVPSSKRYLMTSHDAFRYFTRSYLAESGESDWHKRFAAPEGLAPDGQLSPVDIQRMIDFLRNNQISVLFPESNVSLDSIKKIANAGSELGIEIRVCNETLYGDSMSGLTYFEMMEKNAEIVARYLK
ncbi:MAG TPA: zinc ABC transporter substrate-binding protein [Chlamydiales bacterium]|nr:zinc ABC transporter substrate-binding protein [Chlamydiales bacterium]